MNTTTMMGRARLPETPSTNMPGYTPNSGLVIDMNYLMPFSVMLMILCVLLLILCYLRHRMRQRRRLQRELRLSHILRHPHDVRNLHLDEFGFPTYPDRNNIMYPPTYDEATLHDVHKQIYDTFGQPPPYREHQEVRQQGPTEPGFSADSTESTAISDRPNCAANGHALNNP